jgi:nitroreductase
VKLRKEAAMDIDRLINLLKSRRSIRAFKPDPIPDEFIQKIIEAARWAPSGGNSQPWEFIIVKKKEIKDRIADLFVESTKPVRQAEMTREKELRVPALEREIAEPGFKKAPVFILVCGDPRLNEAFPLLVYQKSGMEILTSNLASAFLCMQLAAKALGLGSQWVSATGGFMGNPLKKLLDIPEEFRIYDMMAAGYPAYQLGSRSPRKIEDMIHHDRYDRSKLRTDQEIKDFIIHLRNADREEMERLTRGS